MSVTGKQKQIGRALFRVLVEKAIDCIPVVGPWFTLGRDIFKSVKEEIDKEEGSPVSQQEMADALHSLSYAEAIDTVDSVLGSPEGQEKLHKLSPEDREKVRSRLLTLPAEFDRILADLEDQEKKDAEAEAERKRREEEESRRTRERLFQRYQEELKVQLENKQYAEAYSTVEKILQINPDDKQALKVQVWLEQRLNKTLLRDVLIGGGVGAVCGMIGAHGKPGDTAFLIIGVFAGIGAVIAFISSSVRRLNRWRKL
jgi:hypothetical protein